MNTDPEKCEAIKSKKKNHKNSDTRRNGIFRSEFRIRYLFRIIHRRHTYSNFRRKSPHRIQRIVARSF